MPVTLPPALSAARWRRPLRLALAVALVLPALAWAVAVMAVWLAQERLLFRPVPLPPDAPLSTEPDVHERFVDVPGARLSVLELRRPAPDGVVFFLHGNNDNLKTWFTGGELYRRLNFDLVMMDYRGFGKSTGRIASQAQLMDDVDAVWRSVQARYAGKPVVAYGRSLGTGLAAAWAARHQPALTILVSPYASLQALAAQHYPWVPGALLRYPLRSDQALPRIGGPVLLIHGDQDPLIPLAHSQTLAARAPAARLVVIPGAAHGDVHAREPYAAVISDSLRALAGNGGTKKNGPTLSSGPFSRT